MATDQNRPDSGIEQDSGSNRGSEQQPRDSSDDTRGRGTRDDARGLADEESDEFEHAEDLDDEEETDGSM